VAPSRAVLRAARRRCVGPRGQSSRDRPHVRLAPCRAPGTALPQCHPACRGPGAASAGTQGSALALRRCYEPGLRIRDRCPSSRSCSS
jgi:hypothetical protein